MLLENFLCYLKKFKNFVFTKLFFFVLDFFLKKIENYYFKKTFYVFEKILNFSMVLKIIYVLIFLFYKKFSNYPYF